MPSSPYGAFDPGGTIKKKKPADGTGSAKPPAPAPYAGPVRPLGSNTPGLSGQVWNGTAYVPANQAGNSGLASLAGLAGGGGGGGTAPALDLKANTHAGLEALVGRYDKHLTDMEGNTGRVMDVAGSKIRDAREGGRRTLQENALGSGRASDPSLAGYDTDTTRAVTGAISDIALGREANLTNALQGAVGVNSASPTLALQEKNLQLGAYNAQNATANNTFQQFLSLLNATRQSPMYTGS